MIKGDLMGYRREHDSMGEVLVPEDKYWGAQTERSLENFRIGGIRMPEEQIRALAMIKLAAARANARLRPEKMTEEKLSAIESATERVISGELAEHFPLSVFQTGSGTQTNMNVNEVIANLASSASGVLLHPNDDVNMSQSSNDVFPAAMHVSASLMIRERLIPAIDGLVGTLLRIEDENRDAYKSGRTHLQDATPISFSEEVSGWRASLEVDKKMILSALEPLRSLALGGTAVGTGLNAPRGFDAAVCEELSRITGMHLIPAENKYHALSSKGELAFAHGALKALASDLMKIANDVRWLASGPRCGLGEISIPENEPGSSIMPGKVNPTQCEALTMVCVQVMANDVAVGFSASQGNFELNVYMPVAIYNFLSSTALLSDAIDSFTRNCASGIVANKERMREYLDKSLMTATALTPIIGYENAARVVHLAHKEGKTLREAALLLGYLDGKSFDESFHPEKMI